MMADPTLLGARIWSERTQEHNGHRFGLPRFGESSRIADQLVHIDGCYEAEGWVSSVQPNM